MDRTRQQIPIQRPPDQQRRLRAPRGGARARAAGRQQPRNNRDRRRREKQRSRPCAARASLAFGGVFGDREQAGAGWLARLTDRQRELLAQRAQPPGGDPIVAEERTVPDA